MKTRILITAALAILAFALVAPRSLMPANTIGILNNPDLQAQYDKQCSHLIVNYSIGAEQLGSAAFTFQTFNFVDSGRTEVLDVGDLWTQPTVGIIEWEYTGSDPATFVCHASANLRNDTSAAVGVYMNIGKHVGGAVVDGDESLTSNNYAQPASTTYFNRVSASWRYNLATGDRVAPMWGYLGNIRWREVDFECKQQTIPDLAGGTWGCWR